MAKVKHTDGPWAFNDEANRIESDAPGYPNDGWAICELMGVDIIGNARLIVAAPELLKIAQRCLAMVETDDGPPDWDWIRSVLRKVGSPL